MEKAKNVIETTFRCMRCKKNLVITEKQGVTFFGCPRCDCYVIVLQWQIREFRHKGHFNWRGFMKYLYRSYLDAREFICK
jgi:phage FluMu protein Com